MGRRMESVALVGMTSRLIAKSLVAKLLQGPWDPKAGLTTALMVGVQYMQVRGAGRRRYRSGC